MPSDDADDHAQLWGKDSRSPRPRHWAAVFYGALPVILLALMAAARRANDC